MTNYYKKVEEFAKAFDVKCSNNTDGFEQNNPNHSESSRNLRMRLLEEEMREYLEAEKTNDFVEIADALADIIYIAAGTALCYGIPLDDVFDEVHRSNMAKLGADGKPLRREDGKIIKPKNWTPPDIEGVLKKLKNNS